MTKHAFTTEERIQLGVRIRLSTANELKDAAYTLNVPQSEILDTALSNYLAAIRDAYGKPWKIKPRR